MSMPAINQYSTDIFLHDQSSHNSLDCNNQNTGEHQTELANIYT